MEKLKLFPFTKEEVSLAYPKFKEALFDFSEAAFGWDEKFQRERFDQAYRPEWFFWLQQDSKPVGYVCYEIKPNNLELHLLIIFNEFQAQGFGKKAMKLVHDVARKEKVNVSLSTLKNNTPAIKLYQNLGYQITGQDDYFYEMTSKGLT